MGELALSAIGGELMGGTLLGGVVGWGMKKMFNIVKIVAAMFAAVQIAVLGWLDHHEIITVHPDALWTTSSNLAGSGAASGAADAAMGFYNLILNVMPVGTGVVMGMAIGWRRG